MDVAVDPEGRQRCVVEALRERPNDQFAQAGVRCLLRLGTELFGRNLKMKPVSREGRDLRMDHLYQLRLAEWKVQMTWRLSLGWVVIALACLIEDFSLSGIRANPDHPSLFHGHQS